VTYESITEEMIEALDDEIDAIKKGAGGQQIGLQDGVKRGFSAGRYLYSFNLAFELNVPDDTPAQLIVGQTSYNVTVVTVDGFEIALALTEDLGERVPFAKLNTSPYYLLEILKTRLQETLSGTLKVNKEMAMRLFNQRENERLPSESPVEVPSVGDQRPNSEQQRAPLVAKRARLIAEATMRITGGDVAGAIPHLDQGEREADRAILAGDAEVQHYRLKALREWAAKRG